MARISKEAQKQVRMRLLQSAAKHFAEHGLAGANINRISMDAGFAKGTVYNYFPSKEVLFGEVLAVGSEQTVAQYRARSVDADARAQLLAIVEEDVALVRQHEAFMKTFVREWAAPQASMRALVNDAVAPLVSEVATIVSDGQRRGQIRTDMSAIGLASAFLGNMTMMYVLHWNSEGQWPTWEELPQLTVALFLEGAVPGARPS